MNDTQQAVFACFRDFTAERGTRRIWYVRMNDGGLIDCGADDSGKARAVLVANAINTAPRADDDTPNLPFGNATGE